MWVSGRKALLAGVACCGAVALAVPQAVNAPPPTRQHIAEVPVALAAATAPLPVPPKPVLLTSGPDETPVALVSASSARSVTLTPVPQPEAAVAPVAADDITTQNAASNLIDSVYAFSKYWANYAALTLAPWALGFIPFGWIATDQINIWYPQLVGVTDAFVYQFLDPVVNDPLNPAAWVDGIVAIGAAVVDGVIDGLIGELYWAWSLLPLPPLPPRPGIVSTTELAATDAVEMSLMSDLTTDVVGEQEVLPEGVLVPEEAKTVLEPETPALVEQPTTPEVVETQELTDEVPTDLVSVAEKPAGEIVETTDEVVEDEVTEDEVTEDEVTDAEVTDAEVTEDEVADEEVTEDDVTEDEPEAHEPEDNETDNETDES